MPNGGVPKHMALFPKDGTTVLYCTGGELRVIERSAWEAQKAAATPLCTLSVAEGAALGWFLRYWIGEGRLQPGYNMRGQVQAEFDF